MSKVERAKDSNVSKIGLGMGELKNGVKKRTK